MDDIYEGALIWQACRATTAASSFFEPITIGRNQSTCQTGMVFLDGATRANNPIVKLWEEAATVFGDDFENRLQLALSIGTGVPEMRAFGIGLASVARTLVRIATETEDTNCDFERAHRALVRDDRFFRFNVEVGLGNVGLEEAKRQARIRAATHRYLELGRIQRRVEAFVSRATPRGMWGWCG